MIESMQYASSRSGKSPLCGGIIIPVFNENGLLPVLIDEIEKVASHLKNLSLEVLIVDDGSAEPLPGFSGTGLEIKSIRHSRNRGKGAALQTGFQYLLNQSQIQFIITIDADLQHPPEFIPQFIQAFLANKGNVIIGYRKRELRKMPLHRIFSNTLTSLILSFLIRQFVRDSQCGYRLYTREVLQSIQTREEGFHLESEMILRSGWRGFKIGFVPIPTIYNGSPSSIKNMNDTWKFIKVIMMTTRDRLLGYV